MRKAWRAIVAGVASTFVHMSILLLVDVQTRARLPLFEALARLFRVPGQVGLGFLISVTFGVIVWPLLFIFVEPYLPPKDDEAVSGMLFAIGLWVGVVLLGTAEMRYLLLPFYLGATLVTNLAYGFTLGLVYGWAPLSEPGASRATGRGIDGGQQ